MFPTAVHLAISTVRCFFKPFRLNALILRRGNVSFVRLIEHTGE
jgi:hypothetical protein